MSSDASVPSPENGEGSTAANNRSSSSSFSRDQLAANLQKCAILVKKGDKKDPLIRQTIHDLTYYLTGKRVRHVVNVQKTVTHIPPPASPGAAAATVSTNPPPAPVTESPRSTANTTTTVSKHHHRGIGDVIGKILAAHDEAAGAVKSDSAKAATSAKNAARFKAEVEKSSSTVATTTAAAPSSTTTKHVTTTTDWCDVHFTRGCGCQSQQQRQSAGQKPAFQRPSNPQSTLIANGWIEQLRRSKMRPVWKDVLASLVEGRKPGEVTTLWIQREKQNEHTGKMELEALNQIPVKWIQEIGYSSYSTENRFTIKVYNLQEEFVFRCTTEEAAQNWVLTLRSMQETAQKAAGKKPVEEAMPEWDEIPKTHHPSSSFEEEKKAPEHPTAPGGGVPHPSAPPKPPPPSNGMPPPPAAADAKPAAAAAAQRMSVKELRAIAHGAGITTHGMERGELERVVQQLFANVTVSTAPAPPAAARSPEPNKESPLPDRSVAEDMEKRRHEAEAARNRAAEEAAAKQREEAEAAARQRQQQEAAEAAARQRQQQEAAAARIRAAAEAAIARQRQQQEEAKRQEMEKRQREEAERQRLAAERQRREEEEHRRRLADMQAAEEQRRKEEQQRQQQQQYQEQQRRWQEQQAAEERRRQAEAQRAAEERRRQEENFRVQQQWQQQRQQQQPQQRANGPQPPQQWQQPPPQYPYPPHGHVPPHPQPPFFPHGPPPGVGQPPPPHPPAANHNMKYAKMAGEAGDGMHMTIQKIRHGILVEWALQPPAMQTLRPIEHLISSIHTVFPPKFGVPPHEHFQKWTIVTLPELMSGAQPDDEKLKKTVRKLRLLLHPDKLPREFSEEHQFMCKMLWDITSDAFEDHKKREEELGWMR